MPTPNHDHARAAFEQGAWLAELELLALGQRLRQQAQCSPNPEPELFDLLITIADVLEADHGWSPQQSEAWLERLGAWELD